jgi:hypothetical protein
MTIDTSLPISNKGTNGSPITDSGGNPLQGVEVTLWRRVLNDTNSDGEGDEITDTKLLARKQTDSNGEYEFTEDDVPTTYVQGSSEVIYYCTVHAIRVKAGSGDPLDNGRIKAYDATNEPAASDYMAAYSLQSPLVPDGLVHYYNPNEITASTGSGVSTFPDSEGSEDLTGGTPTYEANAMGSVDAPVYDATDDRLEASTPSDWNFLHDGTQDFEMFVVVQPSVSGSNDMTDRFGNIVGNATGTKDDRGLVLGFDDRDSQGKDDQLFFSVGNGSSFVAEEYSSGGELPKGQISIINLRFDSSQDEYIIENNETQIISAAGGGYSSGDSVVPYTLGDPQGGFIKPFGGAIGDNAIYDRVLTSSERSDNYSVLANKYGVTL